MNIQLTNIDEIDHKTTKFVLIGNCVIDLTDRILQINDELFNIIETVQPKRNIPYYEVKVIRGEFGTNSSNHKKYSDGCIINTVTIKNNIIEDNIAIKELENFSPPAEKEKINEVCGFDPKTFQSSTFPSGAKTSEIKPPYHLIPLNALKREALAFKKGADHYGENNWQKGKGDDKFIKERANHLIEHIMLWLSGDRKEDHLANVRCNAAILMELTDGSKEK